MRGIIVLLVSALAAVSLANPQKCLKKHAYCDGLTGPQGKCCKGLYCPPAILDVAYCTPKGQKPWYPQPEPQCIPDGSFCVGIAGPVGECCPGFQCEYEGPDNSVCRPEPDGDTKCLKLGQKCKNVKGPYNYCCRGMECKGKGVCESVLTSSSG